MNATLLRWFLITATLLSHASGWSATLTLEDGQNRITFDTAALLARTDVAEIQIPADNAYGGPRRYRAVPLAALLTDLPPPPSASDLEAAASDGYAAQIPLPLALEAAPGVARAWVAIEPTDIPWPPLPGKKTGAGPFYIVWERPEASHIPSKYWAYKLAALRYVPPPSLRWPQIAVDPSLPADHPARAGYGVFETNCLPCHRINGGGPSDIGPDLNLPMNPTEYFLQPALRRHIRDPKSVRIWPGQRMPGQALNEPELEAVITYLEHMAQARR